MNAESDHTEKKIVGKKNDAGKLRWFLLPTRPIEEVIRVLMKGAETYGDFNWQHVKGAQERYYDAACRHLADWKEGVRDDKDTHLHVLAHAVCDLLFILWFELKDVRRVHRKKKLTSVEKSTEGQPAIPIATVSWSSNATNPTLFVPLPPEPLPADESPEVK